MGTLHNIIQIIIFFSNSTEGREKRLVLDPNLFKMSLVWAFLAGPKLALEPERFMRCLWCSLHLDPRGHTPVLEKSGHTSVCFFLHCEESRTFLMLYFFMFRLTMDVLWVGYEHVGHCQVKRKQRFHVCHTL